MGYEIDPGYKVLPNHHEAFRAAHPTFAVATIMMGAASQWYIYMLFYFALVFVSGGFCFSRWFLCVLWLS